MKTILYIQYFDPAAFPPLERSAQQFLDRGWRVHFLGIAPDRSYPKFATLRHPNLSIALRRHRPGSMGDIAAYHLDALRTIATLRPDVVYVSQEKVALIGLIASVLPKTTAVLHEHDMPFLPGDRKTAVRLLRKLFARLADLCVIPQKQRAEDFQQETGARRVAVAYNTPSLREIGKAPTPRDGDELILWHHGSLGPSRLPPTLVDALALLPKQVSLRFAGYETVGTRGYVDSLLRKAVDLGVADRVTYLGPIEGRQDLYAAAAGCDVGVALFTEHGQWQPMAGASNKPFDFMSAGLSLLTSDSPEWTEFFKDEGVALSCDPGSPEDIARAVKWYFDHPAERAAMGARGHALIRSRWNYEASFAPVMDFLDPPPGAIRLPEHLTETRA